MDAFRNYHIPEGAMDAKADEFRNIKMMGLERVHEFTNCFTNLMCYAPPECVTTEK